MNISRYLARRFVMSGRLGARQVAVLLAVLSIAVGVAVMNISLAIVEGFEAALEQKITGFVADIAIQPYQQTRGSEKVPLTHRPETLAEIEQTLGPALRHVQPVLTHEGLLRSETTHAGIRLRGMPPDWDGGFFADRLVAGRLPNFPDSGFGRELLISRSLARELELAPGDAARLVFYREGRARFRKAQIAGLYETGLAEFDESIIFCDLRLLQHLLHWEADEYTGYSIFLHEGAERSLLAYRMNEGLPYDLKATPVEQRFPQLFDWLGLQHQNVWFILILMFLIAVVNMSTAILILITERTRAIGLLKALGATNRQVQVSFLWQAAILIGLGLIGGDLLSTLLLAVQDATGWVSLDPANYFIRTVPVRWPWGKMLGVNLGVLVLCTVAMWLPAIAVLRVSPVRALRFR